MVTFIYPTNTGELVNIRQCTLDIDNMSIEASLVRTRSLMTFWSVRSKSIPPSDWRYVLNRQVIVVSAMWRVPYFNDICQLYRNDSREVRSMPLIRNACDTRQGWPLEIKKWVICYHTLWFNCIWRRFANLSVPLGLAFTSCKIVWKEATPNLDPWIRT